MVGFYDYVDEHSVSVNSFVALLVGYLAITHFPAECLSEGPSQTLVIPTYLAYFNFYLCIYNRRLCSL